MRLAIFTTLPLLLGAAYANYYVDCDDDKGHHEKKNEPMKTGDHSECHQFDYGMKNFEYWQDDGNNYDFEFFEDSECKGKKHKGKAEKEKKNKKKSKSPKDCWSYIAYCE
ncbi:hypothetical protein B0A48_18511 [Cryoendolithus antarcticus]|uniref:Uncharacterized protein n=1 Tax=Cryoendolithus antarcticus TaxID=1507870 RepID=A0A1V8S8H8_9PEZI|nr:hypothetical protein B0A48_18511 [Cryoendolithus antarcticus]